MKLINNKKFLTVSRKSKLLKLKLLKTKVYRTEKHLKVFKLEEIKSRLKKVLHLLYEYHLKNKKILFVGVPFKLAQKVDRFFKNTSHVLLPEAIWMNGVFTNPYSCFQYLFLIQQNKKKYISQFLLKLKNKPDLIVICNENLSESIISESQKSKIPIVTLNSKLSILNSKVTYKISNNFVTAKKQQHNNFYYSIILAVIMKAKKQLILHQKRTNKQNQYLNKFL